MPKRSCTVIDDWSKLDQVLTQIGPVSKPRKLSKDTEVEVRECLTEYASKIPHHDIDSLGQKIKITSVKEHLVFQVELSSLFETRHVVRGERPFDGRQLPEPQTTEQNIDPWSYSLRPATEFRKGEKEHRIDDSQQIMLCGACAGRKRVKCHGCSGSGWVECPRCGSDGVVTCERCSGEGHVQVRNGTKQVVRQCGIFCSGSECSTCRGTGLYYVDEPNYAIVPCTCGSGVVTCPTCGGLGKVHCETCGSSGKLNCEKCAATGQVVSFLSVVQTFEPKVGKTTVPAAALRDPDVVELLEPTDFSSIISLRTTRIPAAVTLNAGSAGLRDGIGQVFKKTLGKVPKHALITRQELDIVTAAVLEVAYEYRGKQYVLCLVGDGQEVHAPKSPITDILKGMIRDGLKEWKSGEGKDAALLIRQAMDMAEADHYCKAAYDEVKHAIPADLKSKAKFYRWKPWVIAGAVLASVILVVWVVAFMLMMKQSGYNSEYPEAAGTRSEPGTLNQTTVGDKDKTGDSGGEDNDAQGVLTARYLPHRPGTTRYYDTVMYLPNGTNAVFRKKKVYEEQGVIRSTDVSVGVLESGDIQNQTAKIRWLKETNMPSEHPEHHRRNGGLIEIGGHPTETDKITWQPELKIGAKPGESWVWEFGGSKWTYTFVEFTQHKGRPAAVVRTDMPVGDSTWMIFHIYVKDVGEVSRITWELSQGKPAQKKGEIVLVESPEAGNQTVPSVSGAEVSVGFREFAISLDPGKTRNIRVSVDRGKNALGEVTLTFETPASIQAPAEVKVEKGQVEVVVPITAGQKPGTYTIRVIPKGLQNKPILVWESCLVTVNEPSNKPKVTADYFPHVKDRIQVYDHAIVQVGTGGVAVMRMEHTDKGDGAIEARVVKTGILIGNDLQTGTVRWSTQAPPKAVQMYYRRERDGMIELGAQGKAKDDISWAPILKIDASEGDSWTWNLPTGETKRFTILKFDQKKDRLSVQVRAVRSQPNTAAVTVTVDTYVLGVGKVEATDAITIGTESTVIMQSLLVEK